MFNFGSFLQKTHKCKCKSCRSCQALSYEYTVYVKQSASIQTSTSLSTFEGDFIHYSFAALTLPPASKSDGRSFSESQQAPLKKT